MTTYTRPVLLLLCGLLLLTLAIAVLNTLVPLWLAHDHLPTWQVGMGSTAATTWRPSSLPQAVSAWGSPLASGAGLSGDSSPALAAP
jgi:hypothetical protein